MLKLISVGRRALTCSLTCRAVGGVAPRLARHGVRCGSVCVAGEHVGRGVHVAGGENSSFEANSKHINTRSVTRAQRRHTRRPGSTIQAPAAGESQHQLSGVSALSGRPALALTHWPHDWPTAPLSSPVAVRGCMAVGNRQATCTTAVSVCQVRGGYTFPKGLCMH